MEYGRIVGESTSVGGRSGGSGDVTGQIMDAVSDAADQVAALPPEMLVVLAVVAVIGLMIFRR
jgi:hypothetical protein